MVTYSTADTLLGYTNNPMDTLICPADTSKDVTVRPLPIPKLIGPGNNTRFCSNDTLQPLVPATYVNATWSTFQDTSNGVSFITVGVPDTCLLYTSPSPRDRG